MTAAKADNPLREALRPFADFADPRNKIPPDTILTAGSAMARKQITMADCYAARAALASEPVPGTDDRSSNDESGCPRKCGEATDSGGSGNDRNSEDTMQGDRPAAVVKVPSLERSAPPGPAGREAPLDLAWEAINALGGSAEQNNSYDQGLVDGIDKALEAIEKLGGEDPLPKRNGPVVSPQGRGATSSPPPVRTTHNSGEGDPSVMPDSGGGETTPPAPGAADRAEWQPIETAPRDRFILLYCPEDDSRWFAKWQGGEWYGSDCEHGIRRTGHSAGDPDYVTGWFVTLWRDVPTLPRADRSAVTPSAPGVSAPAQPLPEQNPSGPRPPGERP